MRGGHGCAGGRYGAAQGSNGAFFAGCELEVEMSRPMYENEESLALEREFLTRLEGVWGSDIHKLPISYHLDAFCRRRDTGGGSWLEVKRRSHDYGTYPDVMLSILKWDRGVSLSYTTGRPFLFAVRFTDCDAVYRFKQGDELEFAIVHGGRTKNTRDDADVEPVIHIPIERFIKVVDKRE